MAFPENLGIIFSVAWGLAAVIWFQMGDNPAYSKHNIKVITHNDVIEKHLSEYKDLIGSDYPGYRNHLYRVLTYSVHILNYDVTHLDVMGSALVYHDIGLWTDKTLAYLEPSAELARRKCPTYTEEQLTLQDNIIMYHHKIWPFRGENAAVVNAVRQADWIDATNGAVTKGMPRKHIDTVNAALPASGFYDTLKDIGPRLHGDNVYKIISEIITIYKW